jgi:hypothetical protein
VTDNSDVIALAGIAASFVMSAAALGVSVILGNRSSQAATVSAAEAQRSADAAERANELVEQARRRGVRAPDATTDEARAVGWEIERGSKVLRLRNVGEASATNVSVEPSPQVIVHADGPPTIEPNGAVDLTLATAFGEVDPTFVLVSWDDVAAPLRVPIPPA